MRRRLAFIFVLCVLSSAAHAHAQEPDLRTVLQRAAAYVDDFTRKFSGVVAEESYVQDVEAGPGRRSPGIAHRELKADSLLVLVPDRGYVQFRDVFEVDGRAVRDRQDRLSRLFLNAGSSGAQAEAIVAESARYNIGRATRTVNTQPMLSLLMLAADIQAQFDFKRTSDAKPANLKTSESAAAAYGLSSGLWVIEYHESGRGAFLRTPQGKVLRAQGRFWIEPATGRVVMTELMTDDYEVVTTIDVSYQVDAALGFAVPAEMRERYVLSPDGMVVSGVATYSRFRRFSVQTDETIAAPPK